MSRGLKPDSRFAALFAGASLPVLLLGGCPGEPNGGNGGGGFNNTTDPTNNGATYISSAACLACHSDLAGTIELHGHSQALHLIDDGAPEYPAAGTRAGVPDPPDGYTWDDVSYVISGYTHGAFFVDDAGYVMTTGVDEADTQYNLKFAPTDTAAGFVPYQPEQADALPYDYETCFRCHTTGPQPRDADNPRSQGGRTGVLGTWEEEGVRCEACHGPGSNHAPHPEQRDIFVDATAATCGRCHAPNFDPDTIPVEDNYIKSNTQYAELLASGGHSDFACTVCHNPHASMIYDRDNGWRNQCTACHSDQNMAFHDGLVYERDDYTEELSCQSCHMPFTGRSNAVAGEDVVGTYGGRMGDVRGHIFRIDTVNTELAAMFTTDGTAVQKDDGGRAAVTVHFVCLRCHNAVGNAFLINAAGARGIAEDIHDSPAAGGD